MEYLPVEVSLLSGVEVDLLTGDEELPFKCSECKCRFANETDLKFHMVSHNETASVKKRKCSDCGRIFSAKCELTRHIKNVHLQEKRFKCKLCDKSFNKSYLLKSHYDRHNGIKPFQCSVCGKSFTIKKTLQVHEMVHSEEKPFKCELCPRSFSEKQSLMYHIRNHIGEKPNKCEFCEQLFTSKFSLKAHILRVHEGASKDFICNDCGKAFFRKGDLARHARIHTSSLS